MESVKILDVREAQGRKILLSDYTHIRAFHACRAEGEQIFGIQGLKPYTKDEALKVAICKLENKYVSKKVIETEFNNLWVENTPAKVWLMLETTELLSTSTHYLIYGSEFLNALAMQLGCRDRLKKFGKPIVVACNIPISDISSCWLNDLELDIKNKNTGHRSIAVNAVAPENIIEIQYPTGYVCDPYSWRKYKIG